MNQEIRVILAVVLSAAIFMVYQTFFAPPLPSAPLPQTAIATPAAPAPQAAVPAAAPVDDSARDESFTAEAREIKIVTDKIAAVIDTVGATITSYKLKEYQASAAADAPFKDLLREEKDSSATFLGVKGYDAFTRDRIFRVEGEESLPQGGRRVTLAWQDKNLRVEKIFDFGAGPSPYAIRISYKLVNRSEQNMLLTSYVEDRVRQKPVPESRGWLESLSQQQPDLFIPHYHSSGKLTAHADWAKFAGDRVTGPVSWTALADRYFVLAAASADPAPGVREARLEREGDFLIARLYGAETGLKAGAQTEGAFLAYIGPKELGELAKMPVPLKAVVDYGWFDFVAVPILWLMGMIHKVIPNWGLVIIALTFIVKMALHPVNKKSLSSMKAMQLLQPKMQEIKKRHPDDKQKQNEEVMQLFRTHKVNPMGGCLPMLLQMPIYIALYKVLWNAIELYHAPFLWYADLSAPDPYFVAPVLLGVFMFFQQKLTPSASADPAQQKMMAFMPVMFSVFMLFLPVGLVIYIFVNTLMSVIQQFMLQRDLTFKDLLTGKWQANGA